MIILFAFTLQLINMSYTVEGAIPQEEHEQNQLEEPHSHFDSFGTDRLEQQLQLPRNEYKAQLNFQIASKHCLPLILAEQIPKPNMKCSEKNKRLHQSQTNRYAVQEKAKQFLIQQSESEHKIGLSNNYLVRRQTRSPDNNKIQGFYQNQYSGQTNLKITKEPITTFKHKKIKSSEEKAQELKRSKRRSLLLQKQQLQPDKEKTNQNKTYQTAHLIKKIMSKIPILKNMNAEFDNTDYLNKNFIMLQEKMYKKRIKSQTIYYKRKQSNKANITNQSNQNQRDLALFTRKISYSSNKQQFLSSSSQHFQKFRLQQKILNTQSQIFQPLNPHLQTRSKKDVPWVKNSKQSTLIPQKLPQNQEAILKIFKTLRDTAINNRISRSRINYQKIQQNYQTLHNIHNDATNRQSAALKFKWNKQRNKKRNASIKSQTVDILKLSLMGQQKRSCIQTIINGQSNSILNKRFKTEPSQSSCKVISPVFLTSK